MTADENVRALPPAHTFRSALPAGHKALSNLGTSGQRCTTRSARAPGWLVEKGRPCAEHNLMSGK